MYVKEGVWGSVDRRLKTTLEEYLSYIVENGKQHSNTERGILVSNLNALCSASLKYAAFTRKGIG